MTAKIETGAALDTMTIDMKDILRTVIFEVLFDRQCSAARRILNVCRDVAYLRRSGTKKASQLQSEAKFVRLSIKVDVQISCLFRSFWHFATHNSRHLILLMREWPVQAFEYSESGKTPAS